MISAIKKLLFAVDKKVPKWMPADKFKHAAICFIPPLVASWYGFFFSAGLALGKELGDHFNPLSKWCWKDLIADAVGMIIGVAINLITLKPLVKYIASLIGVA